MKNFIPTLTQLENAKNDLYNPNNDFPVGHRQSIPIPNHNPENEETKVITFEIQNSDGRCESPKVWVYSGEAIYEDGTSITQINYVVFWEKCAKCKDTSNENCSCSNGFNIVGFEF